MANCCDAPGLMPVEQAMEQMLASIKVMSETEWVSTASAIERVVAQDVVSPLNVPNFNNSAMDGFAYRQQDVTTTATLTLVGKVYAGEVYPKVIQAGECVRIMTGAPLPDGADTVQMQENVVVEQQQVTLTESTKLGQNVRYAGEDIKSGETVLLAGQQLRPADIGLLASLGIAKVLVFKKINIGLFSTGDELAQIGEPLQPGQIYDSNRYFLLALLKRLDVNVTDYGCLPDDLALLRNTLQTAAQENHGLITSGGVSVGEADFTKTVLDEIGQVNFWKLAIKPGKPFAFGKIKQADDADCLFFGLPGNPVSALVTCHQLVVPALHKLSGANTSERMILKAKTTDKLKKRPGRMDFQRGNFSINQDGELVVSSTGSQGSGILTSICQANCYILLEQEQANIEAGETVNIIPFDKVLN